MDKNELSQKLIEHYRSFEYDQLWLDDFDHKGKYVSVCCRVNSPHPSGRLCKNVAKYIRELLGEEGEDYLIYVGAYVFYPDRGEQAARS